jgi:carbonic anhydrase
MQAAIKSLKRLQNGNRRFVSNDLQYCSIPTIDTRRHELVSSQKPFAIVLGCSDSRVPTEIIFDQGLGDLFVIRVAGNIVGPSQIGSVEFAALHFGAQLVVVLGHTRCGAVAATLNELQQRAECPSPHICSILERIRPIVEHAVAVKQQLSQSELLRRATRMNVIASVDQLRHGSPVLEQLIQSSQLMIIGAEYSVETGAVDFFHGLPVS